MFNIALSGVKLLRSWLLEVYSKNVSNLFSLLLNVVLFLLAGWLEFFCRKSVIAMSIIVLRRGHRTNTFFTE